MKKLIVALAAMLFISSAVLSAQNDMTPVLKFIQTKSTIAEGGTELFEYKGTSYLISVAQVIVNTKTEAQCKTVGSAKAKKEMLAYVNGADITSSTILNTSETVVDDINGRRVESTQEYVEKIKETVIGTINQISPLGGWYSADRSVYYFAIYKAV